MFPIQSIDKLKSAFAAQEQKHIGSYYGGLDEIDDYVSSLLVLIYLMEVLFG